MPLSYTWRCPSNIALVKYWGKYGEQFPRNASVSFTLGNAYTETTLSCLPLTTRPIPGEVAMSFRFDGQINTAFAAKIQAYLNKMATFLPFLLQHTWHIETCNSFPHSSGIASSASAMGALALCLCSVARAQYGYFPEDADFWTTASKLARLGSGSACRSIYGQAAVWGTCRLANSSNEYALPFGDYLHPSVRHYRDTILIVSRAEKSVSSRAGHALMEGNPYAPIRYAQATQHLDDMLYALEGGDFDRIIAIAEAEALALHALMMTSVPSYMLMRPATLHIIEKIRQFRTDTQLPVCFTLDAGPNVHVLYPKQAEAAIQPFINSELLPLCENDYHISDQASDGPYSPVANSVF